MPAVPIWPYTLDPVTGIAPDLIALNQSGPTNQAWIANLAVFVPLYLPQPFNASHLFYIKESSAAGNIDIGVYNESFVRQVSTGSVAQSAGSQARQEIASAFSLPRGMYYLAFASDNALVTIRVVAGGAAPFYKLMGLAEQAAAFPLPANAAPVTYTRTFVPLLGLIRSGTL